MKKIISLIIVMVMVLSLGVVSFADERLLKNSDISANIVDKYGNAVTVDNNDVRVVTSPTEDGIVTVKFYKKTGTYEIIDVKGKSTTIDKSVRDEQREFGTESASYPDGTYQNTYYNYEYEANSFVAPWELRRPDAGPFSTYYFWCYENTTTVSSLEDFADAVEVLNDAEGDLILEVGAMGIDLLYAFVTAAPAGQLGQIFAVLEAGAYSSVDIIEAATVVGNAAEDCYDNYYYVFDNYAYND